MVVRGQARVAQLFRLRVGEHAEGDARLHVQRPHSADHVEHLLERRPVLGGPPRGAHAEARGPKFLRPPRPRRDLRDAKRHLRAQQSGGERADLRSDAA